MVVLVGAGLRVYGLDSGLWFDEIALASGIAIYSKRPAAMGPGSGGQRGECRGFL